MKKLLMVSNGEHLPARIAKTAAVLLTTLALGSMFWVASMPIVQAQDMTPAAMIGAELPQGKTVETASKADFLAALCAAVKKNRSAAPALASFAGNLRPEWKKDILRTIFRCLGGDDCRLFSRVLRALTAGDPNASELVDLAIELAPSCASSFGGPPPPDDEGNFGNAPGNQNPPPGSIGGGGGQGNLVAICHNGRTIFVSPQAVDAHLRHGDTLGPCQVTPVTNN